MVLISTYQLFAEEFINVHTFIIKLKYCDGIKKLFVSLI